MTVSILVPFWADDSPEGLHRTRVWNWCRRQWEALRSVGLVAEVIIGHDPLAGLLTDKGWRDGTARVQDADSHKFSVSRALNDAAKHATGSNWLLFGADHVPNPQVVAWAAGELRQHPVIRLHDRVAYATQGSTQIILSSTAFPLDAADWHEVPAPCPGVLAIRREAFEAVGGMDERYEGVGYEDTDLLTSLQRHYTTPPYVRMRPSGWTLRELWHDPSHRVYHNTPNERLYKEKWG